MHIDDVILTSLNVFFDMGMFSVPADDVVADVNMTISDMQITRNDVISVGDRCMSFVYNDDTRCIELV